VVVGGVFNSGLLADPRPGATFDYRVAADHELQRARRIQAVCARYETTMATAALRFPLRHPAVSAVVVGARNPTEAAANAASLEAEIPEDLWSELAASRWGAPEVKD
jgi:D-threo-aldose 1-dehydrogenase